MQLSHATAAKIRPDIVAKKRNSKKKRKKGLKINYSSVFFLLSYVPDLLCTPICVIRTL